MQATLAGCRAHRAVGVGNFESIQPIRLHRTLYCFQSFTKLSMHVWLLVYHNVVPQRYCNVYKLRIFLSQIPICAGRIYSLSFCSQLKLQSICSCQPIHIYCIYGDSGISAPIQSIILIDLFYLAGIKLVARYDGGDSCCGAALILLTVIFEGIAIFLNVLGYIYFSVGDVCGSSVWVNIITSIVLIILPFFQLFNFNKQNSLLTTSLVSLYISYLALICQYSYGGDSCNFFITQVLEEYQ